MTRANHRKEREPRPRVFERSNRRWFHGLFVLCAILSAIHSVEISRTRQTNAVRRHTSLHLSVPFCPDCERLSEEAYSVNCAKTSVNIRYHSLCNVQVSRFTRTWSLEWRWSQFYELVGVATNASVRTTVTGNITDGENNLKNKSLCWKTKIGIQPTDCQCVYLDKISWVKEISRMENDAVESGRGWQSTERASSRDVPA